MIMFCDASPASPAMLASQRFSDHALYTKVFFVEFPQTEELLNDRPLLIAT